MKSFTPIIFAAALAGLAGLSGCGNSETRTVVKKETKIDSDGNEKTKIETKTETRSNSGSDLSTTTKKEIKVESRDDPIVKLGPVEITKH